MCFTVHHPNSLIPTLSYLLPVHPPHSGGRGDRPPRENGGEGGEASADDVANRGRGGRGGGRGEGRGGRGGRGGRREGDGRPRRREYDRHDASGRGSETEKKHGAGKGNWGSTEDEVKMYVGARVFCFFPGGWGDGGMLVYGVVLLGVEWPICMHNIYDAVWYMMPCGTWCCVVGCRKANMYAQYM